MARRIKHATGKQTTVPIKSEKKLNAALDYLIYKMEHAKTKIKYNQAYRNYIFFLTGINTAFRGEDLLQLKVKDVKTGYIRIKENKTGHIQNFYFNKKFHSSLLKYIEYFEFKDNDYLFMGQKSKHTYKGKTFNIIYPMTKQNADYILKKVEIAANIESGCSLHTLRKTFGYHFYLRGGKLATLQKLYGHYSTEQTLEYVMWDLEVDDARQQFFLGKEI